MKMFIKYFICLFMFSFFLCDTVLAEDCSAEDMAKAKALAENVDIKYEYIGKKESTSGLSYDQYHITVTGIVEGIEVGISDDSNNEDIYSIANVSNGTLEFDRGVGEVVVNVYKLACDGKALKTESIILYGKNEYASSDACKKLEKYHLNVCDEDYQGELDGTTFYDTVYPYLEKEAVKSNDGIDNYFKDNFWLFIGVGMLFLVLISFLFYRYRRRSVLK